ncbi:MAG: sialate O-acetylesterase [Bacteroidota bacterium]
MVLQQNTYTSIWGNAAAGEAIEVLGSWDSVATSTFADTKGQWLVQIPTPIAGGPYEIRIKGENQVTIKDVWIGEVWLASGQSNMEWPLDQSEGGIAEIEKANFPQIRFFRVEKAVSSTPRIDCKGKWEKVQPSTIASYSAVAYHFAKKIHQELEVPIGIIQTAWGGTPAEAWTSRNSLESKPAFQGMMRRFDEALSRYREFPEKYSDPIQAGSPGILYNAMLAPLIPFSIQGAIWYQGESNTYDPWAYRQLFPLMVDNWRRKWGYRFSFYFVQIAPFKYENPYSGTGIREAQLLSRRIPRSAMVSTMDIGNPTDIHPRKKKEVGQRLAAHALVKDYERKGLMPEGPLFVKQERIGEELKLTFSHVGEGLELRGENIRAFELAGEDKIFYPAEARIEGAEIYLKSSQVAQPIACRYAWKDEAEASLFNSVGLPASSFRTDDWPILYNKPIITPVYQPARGKFLVSLRYPGSEKHQIHYTINGAEASLNSPIYEEPFFLDAPAEIRARVGYEGVKGSRQAFKAIEENEARKARMLVQSPAHPSYAGKGPQSLTNGVEASTNFKDPQWLGYRDKALEFVMDFKEKKQFQQLSLRFLEDKKVWIYAPLKVSVSSSRNGKKYKRLLELNLANRQLSSEQMAAILEEKIDLSAKKLRFLKIEILRQEEERSEWIFIDEIKVE